TLVEAALVGDLEVADFLDRVPPEFDPDRMLFSGGKHVENATPYGEFAAFLHHVDPGVSDRGEAPYHVLEVHVITGPQRDRFQVTEIRNLWLTHAADWRHDHIEPPGGRVVRVRVPQPAQDGKAAAHGVGTGGQALVRKGLPSGVLLDRLGGEQ